MRPETVAAIRARLQQANQELEGRRVHLADAESDVARHKESVRQLEAEIAAIEADLPPAAVKGGAYQQHAQQHANEAKASERRADAKAPTKGDAK